MYSIDCLVSDVPDNIKGTALYQDYIKNKWIPDNDALLDWRSKLVKLRADNKLKYRDKWYEYEIAATDYLLNLNNTNEN